MQTYHVHKYSWIRLHRRFIVLKAFRELSCVFLYAATAYDSWARGTWIDCTVKRRVTDLHWLYREAKKETVHWDVYVNVHVFLFM